MSDRPIRERQTYPIPNQDGSVPDFRRVGSPLERCELKPPLQKDTPVPSRLKTHPGLNRGKGPID